MLYVLIGIIVGGIVLDQATKLLVVASMTLSESIPLIPDVLHLTYIHNRGAAFGSMTDKRWLFMIVSTVAILGLLIYLFRFRPKSRYVQITLAMIIGGGIGNMIDRFALGYVIDFIDFTLIDFAVFNVADSFVTVGAFMLMGYLILDLIREMKASKAEKETEEHGDATE
jgi:signal peptidase II